MEEQNIHSAEVQGGAENRVYHGAFDELRAFAYRSADGGTPA